MTENTRRLARLALLTALGVVFLVLAGAIPATRLALLAVASFPVCAALMMYGPWWALGVFGATAVLGNLILPGTPGLAYVAFFGYYPLLKSVFERMHRRAWGIGLKFVLYTVVFVLYSLLAREMLMAGVNAMPWPLLYVVGGVAFGVYDWAYSVLIRFYIEKIARYFP